MTITLKDERTSRQDETFFAKGGLIEFVLAQPQQEAAAPKPIAFSATKDDVEVDIALQYEDGYNENTFTFVNNINTHEGGTHLTGFKSALTRTINDYAPRRRTSSRRKTSPSPATTSARASPASCTSRCSEPQFEGQTKTKLGNPEVEGIVKTVVNEHLGNFLEEHPPVARNIIEKAVSAARAREAARKARDLVRKKSGLENARAPRQAGRLLARRPGALRDLPGRGRLRRRQRQAGRATARSRRSCRCGARSSTSSGPGSTRSSATRRSGR